MTQWINIILKEDMQQVDFYQVIKALIFASICLTFKSCTDIVSCDDKVIDEIPITKELSAILVERDCGATTNFSSFIWIGDKTDKFTTKSDRVIFLYEGKSDLVNVTFQNGELIISESIPSDSEFVKREAYKDIKITYQLSINDPLQEPSSLPFHVIKRH